MKKKYFKPNVCIVKMGKSFMDVIPPASQEIKDPDANTNNTFDGEEGNDSSPIWDSSTGE